jgi:transcriptional regulator with XRE-family HTH domain
MVQEPLEQEAESKVRASRFARLLQIIRFYAVLAPRTSGHGGGSKPEFNIANASPLSQRQLARILGVSSTMIHRYESGVIDPLEVSFGVFVRLAKFADISVDNLYFYFSEGLMKERLLSRSTETGGQEINELIDLILKLQGNAVGNDSI